MFPTSLLHYYELNTVKQGLILRHSFIPSGHPSTLSACCTVGLPLTTVLFSVVSGLITALVMYCAGKRKKWRGKSDDVKNKVAKIGPVYDAPRQVVETKHEMALRNNICYITTGTTSNKCD